MTSILPDRLSIDPASDFFHQDVLQRGIGVRFKGRERKDVEEYCISEGWIRVQAGKTVDRRGKPLTIKLSGPVEVWYENPPEGESTEDGSDVAATEAAAPESGPNSDVSAAEAASSESAPQA